MKYSFNWLKELSGTKKTLEKVVEDLTFHSFEVEGLEKGGVEIPGVIVGKILEIKKHPNADKLQLVKVDVGTSTSPQPSPYKGEGVLNIVCGAWNIKVGDNVPVATVGTKLPGMSAEGGSASGGEIKEAEIRGEKSFGMLCAEDELELGKNHDGILILPENAKIGDPVSKYFGSDDSTFEIKILPDRAHDIMNHVGVAREICILEKRKMKYDFDGLILPKKKSRKLKVEIKDTALCPRYIGAVMENIKIKESPEWMKKRLETSGIRAINNVVDATNYVMLELGNPLHAFDAEKITAGKELKIVIRKAKKSEKMRLLDDSEMILDEQDLLITNGETPLALAGIMGGKNSGISESTKALVLESANFNAVGIRKTRTRQNIKTESSDRFEKEIDSNLAEKAMVRLIEILEHTADGKLEGIADIYPKKTKPKKISLKLDYIERLLGENIPKKSVANILNSVGIRTKNKKNSIDCIAPTYRVDLKTQEDLIEEIGRIWGYQKINSSPIFEANLPAKRNEQVFLERKIQDMLTNFGFEEMYNYSFYSKHYVKICGFESIRHLELANPMNPDQKFVRASLAPNILKNVRDNLRNFEEFRIFEIGRTYFPHNGKVEERRMLDIAMTGDKKANLFNDLKGAVENMLESLGISENLNFVLEAKPLKIARPGYSADIMIGEENVGIIGEINPAILSEYKIKSPVVMAEFDLEVLNKYASKLKIYKNISKYPLVTRDVSLLMHSNATYAQIIDAIKKTGGELVKDIKLFDIFEKDGKKSLAFHLEFGKDDRTLESKEADEAVEKIILHLKKDLGVEIRK
jgi:phenylalanyl-tRNA synthetase beta chain